MISITSSTNPEIKHIVKLHQAKYRKKYQETFAQGLRTCQTLITTNSFPLKKLYVTQEILEKHIWIQKYPFCIITQQVMQKISTQTTNPGILGVFRLPSLPQQLPAEKSIILYDLHNPGNIGTIIRTAIAFGISNIITIQGADPLQPKVIESSVGTIGYAKIFQKSWNEILQYQEHNVIDMYALTPRNGEPAESLQNKKNISLIIGNEAHGLPEDVINACNKKVTFIMPGPTESLNASVAASLGIFCITRMN